MYRTCTRTFLFLALVGAVACGDNINPDNPLADGSVPEADMRVAEPDMMVIPDGPPLPPDGIQDVLDATEGPVALEVTQVWVTYLKPLVGNDVAGFFVQRANPGPALFVAVDPATLTPTPAVGDQVTFTVDNVASAGGLLMADAISGFTVVEPGGDVSGLVQDVSNAADLVSNLDLYAAELVTIDATFTSGFGFAGTGHQSASIDSTAIQGDSNLELRMPDTISADLETTYGTILGCTVSTAPTPLWRFFASAQVSVWDATELLDMQCVPRVENAIAINDTTVLLTLSRPIDAASITDPATQFTVDNGLTVSAATVAGAVVTLTTSAQTSGTNYTVTVAGSVTDAQGTGVDAAANTATFAGYTFVPPPEIVINEVDYDQPGADTTEFIELYNFGATPVDLTNLVVALVNGSNSASYDIIPLAAGGTVDAGGYVLIHAAAITPPGGIVAIPLPGSIQNGAPDGLALLDVSTFQVVDALSYEGSISGAAIAGFPLPVDLVEGTAATAVDPGDGSLARIPNGTDTNNADADWQLAATPTPGLSN